MKERYRVDCNMCGWIGYRVNLYECECYLYECNAAFPALVCPNGMNLRRLCPRCWNLRIEIVKNAPMARYETKMLRVRPVWTPKQIKAHMPRRVRLALREKARKAANV